MTVGGSHISRRELQEPIHAYQASSGRWIISETGFSSTGRSIHLTDSKPRTRSTETALEEDDRSKVSIRSDGVVLLGCAQSVAVESMLSFQEVIEWTGIAVFEVWIHSIALFISTMMLAFRIELQFTAISLNAIFAPLFVASAIDYYFLLIVFIRCFVEEKECRAPFMRFAFSWLRVIMVAIFEVLLCYKINGEMQKGEQHNVQFSYNVVFVPIWLIMAGLGFQACRLL